MNNLQVLRDIVSRLIRSSRTRIPHPYLGEIMAKSNVPEADRRALIGWIPEQKEFETLEKIQRRIGSLINPDDRQPKTAVKAGMIMLCDEIPAAKGDSLRRLIEGIQEQPATNIAPRRSRIHPSTRQPGLRRSAGPQHFGYWKPRKPQNPWAHLFNLNKAGDSQTDFTIYLDEAWPEGTDLGVVAGIVWLGSRPDPKVLPMLRQHLREVDGFRDRAVEAVQRLKELGDRVYPFVFKFRPPENVSRKVAYERMIHDSLLILLGWLLPRPSRPLGVVVICEAIDGDHAEGSDHSKEFRGRLAEAARSNPQLFNPWKLKSFVWRQKILGSPENFTPDQVEHQGYLAYADLLAYLTFENQLDQAADVARAVDLASLPGSLTINENTVAVLQNIRNRSASQPGEVLDFLARNLRAPAARSIFKSFRDAVAADVAARSALLHALDARYQQKERDLHSLDRQFQAVQELIGSLEETAPRRLRLLEIGIRLQNANHFGNPAVLGKLEQSYIDLRRRALDNGEADLVAHVDLNLAVRASDRFEPEQARLIVEDLLQEEARLSLLSRAKGHSALGQYLSMIGDYEGARSAFDLALSLIDQADLNDEERNADRDQTAIYRAFNAIDAGFQEARDQVDEIIRTNGLGKERRHQFRHHLRVRFLDSRDALSAERKAYMDSAGDDCYDTHPWQLIAMYRGLFAVELDRHEDASRWFDKALEIALGSMHGSTLRMIAAVIATVAWLETEEPAFHEAALGIMDGGWKDLVPKEPLTDVLPTVAGKVETLLDILIGKPADDAVGLALSVLRFNYR